MSSFRADTLTKASQTSQSSQTGRKALILQGFCPQSRGAFLPTVSDNGPLKRPCSREIESQWTVWPVTHKEAP